MKKNIQGYDLIIPVYNEKNIIKLIDYIYSRTTNLLKIYICYDSDEDITLKILKELGIELGFKQIMTIEQEKGMKKINNSFLEIARQDHAEIFKRMN